MHFSYFYYLQRFMIINLEYKLSKNNIYYEKYKLIFKNFGLEKINLREIKWAIAKNK